jgi:hypothetical protein
MDSGPAHRFAPFGWLETVGGGSHEVRAEIGRLACSTEALWRAQFPLHQGYHVESESSDDAIDLGAARGDFRALVAIRTDWDERTAVRMFGGAACASVAAAEKRAARFAPRALAVGVVLGLGVFLTSCWLVVGEQEPVFPLSGMLMVVLLVFSLFAGGSLGARLGERMAARHVARARRAAASDQSLQDDLERFAGLARVLTQKRAAFGSMHRRQPFRREA